jgi:hypothetical protein
MKRDWSRTLLLIYSITGRGPTIGLLLSKMLLVRGPMALLVVYYSDDRVLVRGLDADILYYLSDMLLVRDPAAGL